MPNSIQAETYSEPYQRLKMQFLATTLTVPEAHSERSQTSKMKLFERNIFSRPLFQPITIYKKSSILDVPLYSEYASGTINYFCNRLQDVWLGSRYTFGMFKACVRYFLRNFCLHQMGALQKLWKMFFISS